MADWLSLQANLILPMSTTLTQSKGRGILERLSTFSPKALPRSKGRGILEKLSTFSLKRLTRTQRRGILEALSTFSALDRLPDRRSMAESPSRTVNYLHFCNETVTLVYIKKGRCSQLPRCQLKRVSLARSTLEDSEPTTDKTLLLEISAKLSIISAPWC
jgi:hypothetical protein